MRLLTQADIRPFWRKTCGPRFALTRTGVRGTDPSARRVQWQMPSPEKLPPMCGCAKERQSSRDHTILSPLSQASLQVTQLKAVVKSDRSLRDSAKNHNQFC